MDFKFALLIISAQICATLALPSCVCTRNYSPVCGSDGQTYANQCVLQCAVSKGDDIKMISNGPCGGYPKLDDNCICIFIYAPVCGTDGETYSNQCTMECLQSKKPTLKVAHPGPCGSKVAEPPCECPDQEKPVCGSDGNTYSNDCKLNCATKDNSQLSIAHSGACDSKVKVVDINFGSQ